MWVQGSAVTVELSVMVEMFSICTVQNGSHRPPVPTKHVTCGKSDCGMEF